MTVLGLIQHQTFVQGLVSSLVIVSLPFGITFDSIVSFAYLVYLKIVNNCKN